jgi:hypothetical protein
MENEQLNLFPTEQPEPPVPSGVRLLLWTLAALGVLLSVAAFATRDQPPASSSLPPAVALPETPAELPHIAPQAEETPYATLMRLDHEQLMRDAAQLMEDQRRGDVSSPDALAHQAQALRDAQQAEIDRTTRK